MIEAAYINVLSFMFNSGGRPWYSVSVLDFWSTGQAINPAPGA